MILIRRIVLFFYTSIVICVCLSGQTFNQNDIIGSWYLTDTSIVNTKDTLIFEKKQNASAFTLWSFQANTTLKISTGTCRRNNYQAKCFSEVLHYNWSFELTNNKEEELYIKFGDKLDKYRIIYLDINSLKLLPLN